MLSVPFVMLCLCCNVVAECCVVPRCDEGFVKCRVLCVGRVVYAASGCAGRCVVVL